MYKIEENQCELIIEKFLEHLSHAGRHICSERQVLHAKILQTLTFFKKHSHSWLTQTALVRFSRNLFRLFNAGICPLHVYSTASDNSVACIEVTKDFSKSIIRFSGRYRVKLAYNRCEKYQLKVSSFTFENC